ncbi:MAG: hypothetical protein ABFD92_20475 [Planctomycetaceae bacterium]|nr:hypothetical protein [Planctomycetaceae bacterium]
MSSTALSQSAAPPAPPAGATGLDLTQPLEARISYWVGMIAKASSRTQIYDARRGLTLDFHAGSGSEFANAFAASLESTITPLLDGLKADDPLLAAKQINLAMALTMVAQAPIEPALKKMVGSSNVAVRYMGWGGYKRIRPALLSGGDAPALDLVATVSAAAGKEDSPMVVGAMLEAMSFSQGGTSAAMNTPVRKAILDVLSRNWKTYCRQVLAADPAWADACSAAMPILADLDAGLGSDKAARKKVRQMMVDMAWCAARIYEKADTKLAEVEAERAKAAEAAVQPPAVQPPADDQPPAGVAVPEGPGSPTPTKVAQNLLEGAMTQVKPKAAAGTAAKPQPPVTKRPAAQQPPANVDHLAGDPTAGGPVRKAKEPTSRPKVTPPPIIKRSIEEDSLGELVTANSSLLRSAEIAMAAASGSSRNAIRRALASGDDKNRGINVIRAVSEWVEAFKDDGIRLPIESDFGPTADPAAPAGK